MSLTNLVMGSLVCKADICGIPSKGRHPKKVPPVPLMLPFTPESTTFTGVATFAGTLRSKRAITTWVAALGSSLIEDTQKTFSGSFPLLPEGKTSGPKVTRTGKPFTSLGVF